MGTYVIPFNNRFPTPMMVYLLINEMIGGEMFNMPDVIR